jgi:N-acetylmuramoyl-L-alanine amidase
MISSLFKKREHKLRESILRGVFEDNLRILGKTPYRISGKMPLSFKKLSLSFFAIFLFILGYGNSLNLPLFQEKQTIAYSNTQYFHSIESPFPQTVLSVDPSDVKAFLTPPVFPLSRTFGLTVKTIMIDPGHGGSQTGTIGKMGTQEKDITLDIARRLKELLEKHGGFHVFMTREKDVTLPLTKRVALAHSYKADLFISIHVNYVPSRPINIIETYFFGQPSDAMTLKLAERENAD